MGVSLKTVTKIHRAPCATHIHQAEERRIRKSPLRIPSSGNFLRQLLELWCGSYGLHGNSGRL